MKILFATSEAAPFIKTGGLGDVAGSLPPVLKEKGVDVRVILPMYRCIDEKYREQMRYINHIYIDMAWRKQYCGVFELEYDGCTFYFIDNLFYFSGDKPYGYIHEDCEKFLFFSKAVLSILPTIDFRPDVIHCNDWQTGAIPVFLDTFQDNPFYRGIKTMMTVHNLKFQGRWDFKGIKDVMGISDYYFTSDKLEYHKDANLLKGGLVYANKISTVSETYAGEITTQEYGEGLDGLLRARYNDLVGIVNGISYAEWNPETDPMIFEQYTKQTVTEKKKINKRRLQEQCNIPIDENKFTVGIVSRLTDQKGFDLLSYAMDSLCSENIQLFILGTGDERYENLFRHYAWKYPDKISANIYFSNDLSHKIYAACDAFLMPSRFEPCGLSQIISMRYGTLPIVRETGGLKDTVLPYNEYTGEGTGFSFANYSADDMMYVIRYAMNVYYHQREKWEQLMQNAMNVDYSWDKSADKYIALYQSMTGIYDLPKDMPPVQEKKKDLIEQAEEKPQARQDEKKKTVSKTAVKKTAKSDETQEQTAETDHTILTEPDPEPKIIETTQRKTREKKQETETPALPEEPPVKTAEKKSAENSTETEKAAAPKRRPRQKKQETETPALPKEPPVKTAEKKSAESNTEKTAASQRKPRQKKQEKETSAPREETTDQVKETQKPKKNPPAKKQTKRTPKE